MNEDLNKFISSIVPKRDIIAVKKELHRIKKGGGKRNKRRKQRGGGKIKTLTILVIIIGLCVAFSGHCQVQMDTIPYSQFQNSSMFDGTSIFYCHELNIYTKYITAWYSIFGREKAMYLINNVLALAKENVLALYSPGGVGTTGIGAGGVVGVTGLKFLYSKFMTPTPGKKKAVLSRKFKLLEDKIERIHTGKEIAPPKPKKPWNKIDKIANPQTGVLVSVTGKTGLLVLSRYIQDKGKVLDQITFPNICNPKTGLWMDVRSDIGKRILKTYIDRQ